MSINECLYCITRRACRQAGVICLTRVPAPFCPPHHTHKHACAQNRDTIAEGIEGKQSDLFEEIGVDTDEAAGLTLAAVEGLGAKSLKQQRPGGGQGAAGIKRQRC